MRSLLLLAALKAVALDEQKSVKFDRAGGGPESRRNPRNQSLTYRERE